MRAHLSLLVAVAGLSLIATACGAPPGDGTDVAPQAQEGTSHGDRYIGPPILLPDLVPTLAISGTGYPYVYPPVEAYVTNAGQGASPASKMTLECIAYDSGGFYIGQCFSTIVADIPALQPGQLASPNLPYNPWPIACKAAKCDVRLIADSTSVVNESNENNNQVDQYK